MFCQAKSYKHTCRCQKSTCVGCHFRFGRKETQRIWIGHLLEEMRKRKFFPSIQSHSQNFYHLNTANELPFLKDFENLYEDVCSWSPDANTVEKKVTIAIHHALYIVHIYSSLIYIATKQRCG